MSDPWKKVNIQNVSSIIKRGISPKYTEELTGVTVLNQRCIRDQKVSFKNARKNDTSKKKIPDDRLLQDFDVLINSTGVGTLGRVAQIMKLESKTTVDSHVTVVRLDNSKIDPAFFGIAMRAKQKIFEALGEGSTGQTELSRYRVGEIEFEYPENISEQRFIAHIVGVLDDKIALNRQMNETLEAMAQALFKSWFVDFDPVLDNALAAGNSIPPALELKAAKRAKVAADKKLLAKNPALAALFPSSFEFNEELGKWVPEGWEVKSLGEIASVIGGGTPSTKIKEYFCEEGIAWLSPKDLSGYEWKYISKGAADITTLGLQKSSAKLMPKGSVLFSSRAPIGYIAIAENEICTNQGFKSLIPDKGVPTEYLYQLLKSNASKIESVATGSTFKEVSGSALKSIDVVIASQEVLDQLSQNVKASNERCLLIQKQTRTLSQLRDALLPQLISGKVRVPERSMEITA